MTAELVAESSSSRQESKGPILGTPRGLWSWLNLSEQGCVLTNSQESKTPDKSPKTWSGKGSFPFQFCKDKDSINIFHPSGLSFLVSYFCQRPLSPPIPPGYVSLTLLGHHTSLYSSTNPVSHHASCPAPYATILVEAEITSCWHRYCILLASLPILWSNLVYS